MVVLKEELRRRAIGYLGRSIGEDATPRGPGTRTSRESGEKTNLGATTSGFEKLSMTNKPSAKVFRATNAKKRDSLTGSGRVGRHHPKTDKVASRFQKSNVQNSKVVSKSLRTPLWWRFEKIVDAADAESPFDKLVDDDAFIETIRRKLRNF